MNKVVVSVTIDAPKQEVWNILSDISQVHVYHPGILDSHTTSKSEYGVGASRHCDLPNEIEAEEKITEWIDGEQYTIVLYDGHKMPMVHSL